MRVTLEMPAQEIAVLRQLTRLEGDAEAIIAAAREFLRLGRLRDLKAASGKVEFEANWQEFEELEMDESSLLRCPNQRQTSMTTGTLDDQLIFAFLEKQKKAILLDYLRAAFGAMNAGQRRAVFAGAVRTPTTSSVNAGRLREEIDEFRRDSLAGNYYAPFNMNSKNFMDVPKETNEWCDRFARLATHASKLTGEGEHAQAVACFAPLYELLEALDHGKEIIFADEAGSWMIPAEEKAWLKAYLTSLAATATPEEFTAVALPMIARDSRQSFASRVYASARAAANPQQNARLEAEVKRKKIRPDPAS